MQTQTEFFVMLRKINRIHCFCSSVCSNPCVGPLPKIKISFFLLSIYVDELISTQRIIIFLPVPPLGYR